MIIYYVPEGAIGPVSRYLNVYASETDERGKFLSLHYLGETKIPFWSSGASDQCHVKNMKGVVRICKRKAQRLMKEAGYVLQTFPVTI